MVNLCKIQHSINSTFFSTATIFFDLQQARASIPPRLKAHVANHYFICVSYKHLCLHIQEQQLVNNTEKYENILYYDKGEVIAGGKGAGGG